MFELTRQNGDCLLRESRLVERTNRELGAAIEAKLSDDIYMLFHYLEGTYTIADLKPLLSRSRRNTNTQNDNEDSNRHDVVIHILCCVFCFVCLRLVYGGVQHIVCNSKFERKPQKIITISRSKK